MVSASPTTNMPKRKSITSMSMDASASMGVISPANRTAVAPRSITCQMRKLTPPIFLTAIRRKTTPRTTIDTRPATGITGRESSCLPEITVCLSLGNLPERRPKQDASP